MSRTQFTCTIPVPITVTVNGRLPEWNRVPPLELKLALLAAIDRMNKGDLEQLRFEACGVSKHLEADEPKVEAVTASQKRNAEASS